MGAWGGALGVTPGIVGPRRHTFFAAPRKGICMAKRYGTIGLVLIMVLAAMSAAAAGPKGTERPFKGNNAGEATFLLDNPRGCPGPPVGFGITTRTDTEGTASHLGLITYRSWHCPLFSNELIMGKAVFEAANGDELHADYVGTATPVPPNIGDPIFATSFMTFDPIESTGRFEGATGTAVFEAEVVFEGFADPAWPLVATWHGTVSY